VLGVRDYARKCGFSRAVVGLSGGIDSAVTATVAADALGPERVLGLSMPTRFSSEGSLSDARALADTLGIAYRVIDIDPIFQAYLDRLTPLLDELCAPPQGDVTFENVQARIRGATVMALSNRTGALVLTTGNKSELAVGYCTLYGDMVGGLAVISDVPKTMVYALAHHINAERPRIPVSTLEKPPSAELRPDQKDEDSLPPYDVLDRILELTIEQHLGRREILDRGFDPAVVDRTLHLVRTSEYKRRQAAPGLIITSKAFGPGRRMPMAQGYREV
jgi:NAD+ synthase (glutamine-hydrolysing)